MGILYQVKKQVPYVTKAIIVWQLSALRHLRCTKPWTITSTAGRLGVGFTLNTISLLPEDVDTSGTTIRRVSAYWLIA